MSDVTLSSAVRSNLLSLQTTADLMSMTQERLATGLKVNSALDNPTNFFTASSLNSRASDLARLMDGVSNATQTLEAADNGISAITKLVESAQAVARQAQQSSDTVFVAGVFGSTIVNDTNATVTGTVAIANDVENAVLGEEISGLGTNDTAASFLSPVQSFSGSTSAGSVINQGETLSYLAGGEQIDFAFDVSGGYVPSGSEIVIDASGDMDSVFSALQQAARNQGGNFASFTIGIDGSNQIATTTGQVGAGDLTILDGTSNVFDQALNVIVFPPLAEDTNSILSGLSSTLNLLDTTGTPQSVDMSTINSIEDFAAAIATLGDVSGTIVGDQVLFSADDPWTMLGTGDGWDLGFRQNPQSSDTVNAGLRALDGQTLTIGDDTLTFGSDDSAGQIDTRAEFETALANLTTLNLVASIDATTNQLTISTTGDPNTTFTVGGTVDALAAFGISEWTYTGTSSALTSYSAPSTPEDQTFYFNQGEGLGNTQVSVLGVDSVELLTSLVSLLPGGSYDPVDQRVEFTPLDGVDTITITNNGARKFGLAPGVYAVGDVANPERAEFVDQYNEIMQQIDDLVSDSGFNGVNLIDGDDLAVIFNEDGSSRLDISGSDLTAAGLGLSALGSEGFDSEAGIDGTLDSLGQAIDTLRSQASEFGSNLSIVETREDFTKSMINTLETGAANLTLADTNEEGANLLALQTRQQLSSTALSLASQADQNVLRLF